MSKTYTKVPFAAGEYWNVWMFTVDRKDNTPESLVLQSAVFELSADAKPWQKYQITWWKPKEAKGKLKLQLTLTKIEDDEDTTSSTTATTAADAGGFDVDAL